MSQHVSWRAFLVEHAEGGVVHATVTGVAPFGAILEAGPDVHGLFPRSDWTGEPQVGSTIAVRIAAVDLERRRVQFTAA
ncbi:S1 RNA-binding domain-containing protein [Amycolatopsis acidicola]|uniref:S1 RNA-binding domain-containing protein n=1 Tax=Amycolatopsis acidicola TaxID=2596893 RepID=A0A5N0V382_9PSEU|nr:S1 RNA-binding domain-containing protein [Amycolatopsis acidicola]KAA9160846.1 S1 RNA-binding domain-containing protein [Amycolatopsis acidicola]